MSITDNDHTTSITETVDSHLEAYALADADRREALVAAIWNAAGELTDPPMTGRGLAEISALAGIVLTHYAGHRFERTTTVDAHHGFARYGWNLLAPDGPSLRSRSPIFRQERRIGDLSSEGQVPT